MSNSAEETGRRIGHLTSASMVTAAVLMSVQAFAPWKTIATCAAIAGTGVAIAAACGHRPALPTRQLPTAIEPPPVPPRRKRTCVRVRSIRLPDGTVVTETIGTCDR